MTANDVRTLEFQADKTGTGKGGRSMRLDVRIELDQFVQAAVEAADEPGVQSGDVTHATQASTDRCDWMWNDDTKQFEWCCQDKDGNWDCFGTVKPDNTATVTSLSNGVSVEMSPTDPFGNRSVGTMNMSTGLADLVTDELIRRAAGKIEDPQRVRDGLRKLAGDQYRCTFDDEAGTFVCRDDKGTAMGAGRPAAEIIVRDLRGSVHRT